MSCWTWFACVGTREINCWQCGTRHTQWASVGATAVRPRREINVARRGASTPGVHRGSGGG